MVKSSHVFLQVNKLKASGGFEAMTDLMEDLQAVSLTLLFKGGRETVVIVPQPETQVLNPSPHLSVHVPSAMLSETINLPIIKIGNNNR